MQSESRVWRATLVFAIAALVALSFSSIGSAQQDEKITLHYFTWAGGSAATYIDEDFIQPFEALHPNIDIQYEAVGFGEFFDKLLTYYAAGNPPDLMHMSVAYVYEYAQMGLLQNLTPYFDRDLNPYDFFLPPMDAVRYPSMEAGDLYAIPFAFVMSSLFYNKDLFDQRGVPYIDDTLTWEGIGDLGKRFVQDADGDGTPETWGFSSRPSYELLDAAIHAYGGRTLNDDYTEVLYDSPEGIAATQMLVDLIWEDFVSPPSGNANNMFRQGDLAMNITNMSNLDGFRRDAPFDWDVALMPIGPEKRVVRVWPDSFAISAESPHKEAAWEYVKFVITQTEVDRYSGQRKVPIYKPLATSPDWLEEDLMPNKRIFIESLNYGAPLEFRPKWGEWEPARSRILGAAFSGQADVANTVRQAADQIRAILGI